MAMIVLEDHVRSALKSVTWRVVASTDTFLLAFLLITFGHLTGLKLAGAIASAEMFTKIAIYYLHERAWRKLTRVKEKAVMQTAKPYTPQQFLEDVRTWLVEHAHISEAERRLIIAQPICYVPQDSNPEYQFRKMLGMKDDNMGETLVDGKSGHALATYIYGCDHHYIQMRMAMTLVHEMAHVLTPMEYPGHGPAWAAEARRLGIQASALTPGQDAHVPNRGEDADQWTDAHLYAYAKALPPVDWGDLERDAAAIEQKASLKAVAYGIGHMFPRGMLDEG